MVCLKCRKTLAECTCPDLQARLDHAVKLGAFIYKCCKLCDQHYERCKCEKPEYVIKGLPSDRPENN